MDQIEKSDPPTMESQGLWGWPLECGRLRDVSLPALGGSRSPRVKQTARAAASPSNPEVDAAIAGPMQAFAVVIQASISAGMSRPRATASSTSDARTRAASEAARHVGDGAERHRRHGAIGDAGTPTRG